MLAISRAARSVKASSASSPSGDQGRLSSESTATTPTAYWLYGNRAGEHGADLPGDGGVAEQRPPAVVGQILDTDEFLGVERVDARPFLVLDLKLLQVTESRIRRSHAAQVMLGVGEHQARAVDVEHRVRGVHDLADRVLNLHLTEPQPAQLNESVPHVLQGHVHNHSPHLSRYLPGQELR